MNKLICFCVHGSAQVAVNPQIRKVLRLPPVPPDESLHSKLLRVKESLTEETWQKSKMFKLSPSFSGEEARHLPKDPWS